MWRREVRLEYWLSDGKAPEKPDTASWMKYVFARTFRTLKSAHAVKEYALPIGTRTFSLEEELSVAASVNDGVGTLIHEMDASPAQTQSFEKPCDTTHSVDLLDAASIQNLELPNEGNARIREAAVALKTYSRQLAVSIAAARLHALSCLQDRNVRVMNGGRFLHMNPAIGTRMLPISTLPHLRSGIDMGTLRDAEHQSFLREAEIMKQIPSERAELIAVFRHVPIDLISRLRFFAEKKIILYNLSDTPRRTRTRVHDIAAVRDTGNQEIHLIPHRTQSRAVSFNP
jgi:hypothetical protein